MIIIFVYFFLDLFYNFIILFYIILFNLKFFF